MIDWSKLCLQWQEKRNLRSSSLTKSIQCVEPEARGKMRQVGGSLLNFWFRCRYCLLIDLRVSVTTIEDYSCWEPPIFHGLWMQPLGDVSKNVSTSPCPTSKLVNTWSVTRWREISIQWHQSRFPNWPVSPMATQGQIYRFSFAMVFMNQSEPCRAPKDSRYLIQLNVFF